MTTQAPSRSRSGIDAVFAALKKLGADTKDAALGAIVEACGEDRKQVQNVLAAAQLGRVAGGTSGRWQMFYCTRTGFRDSVIEGYVSGYPETTFDKIIEDLPVSRPQLYTSLARLQVAGKVSALRDGTRTPRYSVSE